jgi:ABC-type multidrug transport system fused ATPase/permease subunit
VGAAGPTLDLIRSFQHSKSCVEIDSFYKNEHDGFVPRVELKNLTFCYPEKFDPAVDSVSISIQPGDSVAIVGPSGSGKSTIVDAILGIVKPSSGEVSISGLEPLDAFAKWPGSVSYVPQDIFIANSSIRENVALGYPVSEINDEIVKNALEKASLEEFWKSLPDGLDTIVGEFGTKISGGQRQRLGIARALFTSPLLLVLDEATSALDGETELSITEAIQKFQGEVTVIMIAHRLATVRNADVVVYVDSGKVVATGTFDQIRKSVPDFDRQAQLMGL